MSYVTCSMVGTGRCSHVALLPPSPGLYSILPIWALGISLKPQVLASTENMGSSPLPLKQEQVSHSALEIMHVVHSNGCQLHERVYSGHSQTAFCPKSSTTPWDGFSALKIAVINCCKVKSGKFYITRQYLSSLLSYLSLCVLLLVEVVFLFFFFWNLTD